MPLRWLLLLVILSVLFAGTGCATDDAPERDRSERADPDVTSLFTELPDDYTNIDFENRLVDSEEMNVFTYRNYYNGGGVGFGDFTGNGLPDLYLVANQGPNKLYLNQGDYWFEDVTDEAGVAGDQEWSTGVSVADVTGNGKLDIYVGNAGNVEGEEKANELFVNQGLNEEGVPQFEEKAGEYGIDDEGFTTHAIFFDSNQNGHLDLYVVNNSFRSIDSFGLENTRHERDDLGGDKLYRNNGDGTFTDESEEAGIYGSEIGFGLGAAVGDVNQNGLLDIHVSNDFFERDYLYLNQGDGTFDEVLPEAMPTISHFSMGSDIGDISNNGFPDIFVTDMLPESDRRLKMTSTFETWDVYQARLDNDYHHQYMRNHLHRNNRDGTFSDIGPIAGVHKTDWSWGALFADFEQNGHKDIFVANGIYKDLTDQDFVDFFANDVRQSVEEGTRRSFDEMLDEIPSTPIPNYAFRNEGDLTFTNKADEWGLGEPSFSNGAAYADLNGDGALDLVVNNVNQELFVYRNEARAKTDNNYLQVDFEGEAPNHFGVGAQVAIEHDGETIYYEHTPMRGFQSSVGYGVTAGVGTADTLEAVTITWPDGRTETREDVAANQQLTVYQENAELSEEESTVQETDLDSPADGDLFAEVTDAVDLDYAHEEDGFVDFNREPLLPRKLSTEGPNIAVGDVTGNGLDDVFMGGAKESAGQLFLQQENGRFETSSEEAFEQDTIADDLGATFFDATGNGHRDLYVVSGGNAFSEGVPGLQDRLYVNDGQGNFQKDADALPRIRESGSVVRPADITGNGAKDLFVGTRLTPWKYGENTSSYILENNGTGQFTDVTDEVLPELEDIGMVTDARWTDVTGNGQLDLVLAGDWMPLTIFEQTETGSFERLEVPELDDTGGWWNRLIAEDLTGNGHTDFVVGNFGENMRLNASAEHPATMHVADFNRNGHVDQVLAHYRPVDGEVYPFDVRGPLVNRMPFLREKYPTHEEFAEETVEDMFSDDQLERATVQETHTLETSVILNQGDGEFAVQPLPYEAQLAPVYGIVAEDLDGNGHTDLLLAGNFHGFEPKFGRLAASYGLYLRGDGTGSFEPVPARESGFFVRGEVRDMQIVDHAEHGPLVVVARNDDAVKVIQPLGGDEGAYAAAATPDE